MSSLPIFPHRLIHGFVVGFLFFLPLFFLPRVLEPLETGKQILLLLVACLTMASLLFHMMRRSCLFFPWGLLAFFPMLFFFTTLISSIFSMAPGLSVFGFQGVVASSLFTTFGVVLLFYTVLFVKKLWHHETAMHMAVLGSGTLLSVHALVLLFSPRPSMDTSSLWSFFSQNFVGSNHALTIVLVAMTFFCSGFWIVCGKDVCLPRPKRATINFMVLSTVILSAVSLVYLLGMDDSRLWIVTLVGASALLIVATVRTDGRVGTVPITIPAIFFAVSLAFLFLRSPFSFGLPEEATPSFFASVHVARETMTQNPVAFLFGSGPGTFLFDFDAHKEWSINQTPFWNTRFTEGSSAVVTLFATQGMVGAGVFLVFIFLLGAKTFLRFIRVKDETSWGSGSSVWAAWAVFVTAMFFDPTNITLTVLFWFFSGLLVARVQPFIKEISLHTHPYLNLVVAASVVLRFVILTTVVASSVAVLASEFFFAKSVTMSRSGASQGEVTRALDRSVAINRWNDVVYRNLAFALLEELRVAGFDDANTAQAFIASSVNAARRATALSPNDAANFEVQGAVYTFIAEVVPGADVHAIEAYERAHALEPANPRHLKNLASAHLVLAGNAERLLGAEDMSVAENAVAQRGANLILAEDALGKALERKGDYAPAHYLLAVVYEKQGRLEEAVTKMETVRRYNPFDVGVAFELGMLYVKQKSFFLARNEFLRTLELAPSYANAWWFLAYAHEQLGEKDAALLALQQLQKFQPDQSLVKQKIEALTQGLETKNFPEPVEE